MLEQTLKTVFEHDTENCEHVSSKIIQASWWSTRQVLSCLTYFMKQLKKKTCERLKKINLKKIKKAYYSRIKSWI